MKAQSSKLVQWFTDLPTLGKVATILVGFITYLYIQGFIQAIYDVNRGVTYLGNMVIMLQLDMVSQEGYRQGVLLMYGL